MSSSTNSSSSHIIINKASDPPETGLVPPTSQFFLRDAVAAAAEGNLELLKALYHQASRQDLVRIPLSPLSPWKPDT